MKKLFTAAALLAVLMLTGCGTAEESSETVTSTVNEVGGAYFKDRDSSQEGPEETEAPEETQEPEEITNYEDSLTAEFVDLLMQRDFAVTMDIYRTDNNEGMENLGRYITQVCEDSAVFETVDIYWDRRYLIGGTWYAKNEDGTVDLAGEGSFESEEGAGELVKRVMLQHPAQLDFISSEEYADGTVEESFSIEEGGVLHTIVYTYDGGSGDLISISTDDHKLVTAELRTNIGEVSVPKEVLDYAQSADGNGIQ